MLHHCLGSRRSTCVSPQPLLAFCWGRVSVSHVCLCPNYCHVMLSLLIRMCPVKWVWILQCSHYAGHCRVCDTPTTRTGTQYSGCSSAQTQAGDFRVKGLAVRESCNCQHTLRNRRPHHLTTKTKQKLEHMSRRGNSLGSEHDTLGHRGGLALLRGQGT